MVKLQAPCLSLEASGSIAGAIVYSKWKGRPYARSLVRPANPRSGGQVGIRSMFKFLSQKWAAIVAANQATWETKANQQVISEFNAYVGYNQFRWADFLAPTQHDPEDTTDTPATLGVLAAVPGVRSITVTQPVTVAGDGWGVMFFRSPTGTFDTAVDNLVHGGLIAATADVIFVDSPLEAGTYYYNTREFTEDGQLSAETGEVSAEVT